jgi:hypothetical protein
MRTIETDETPTCSASWGRVKKMDAGGNKPKRMIAARKELDLRVELETRWEIWVEGNALWVYCREKNAHLWSYTPPPKYTTAFLIYRIS